jgi:hypothetical protein
MKNKLAKQAYFIKRLRDSGYHVDKVFDKYSLSDPRAWTIIINPGIASLFCTCYSNHGETKGVDLKSTCYFEFFDGGQFIPSRIKLDTSSFEVIVTRLLEFGITPINSKPQITQQ